MTAIITGPGTLDWELYAGDANRRTFQFLAGDDPWDITGAVIEAHARVTDLDPAPALIATCTIDTIGPGLATVEWDGEVIRTLLANEETWAGVWDLQITEAGQTLPTTLLRGKVTAVQDVTKPVTP